MGSKGRDRRSQERQTRQQIESQKRQQQEALRQERGALIGREAGQEEALQRATQAQQAGEQGFMEATSGTPESIVRLQQLIRERALPEQQQALSRTKLAQQQAGVRGVEAALGAQMQASQMGKDLASQAEQIALQQALADRQARAQYGQQKALAGLSQELAPVQKYIQQERESNKKGKRAKGISPESVLGR